MTRLDYYLWDAVKDKCYAGKPETIDALKDNIRKAIGRIQLPTIDNVLKNLDRSCRLLHGQLRQPFEGNYFPSLTGRIVLSNKIKNWRKYSAVYFKAFPTKKRYLSSPLLMKMIRMTRIIHQNLHS